MVPDVFRLRWVNGCRFDFISDEKTNMTLTMVINGTNVFELWHNNSTNKLTTINVDTNGVWYVHDFNGDGIPDMRTSEDHKKKEVFIDSEFQEAHITNGSWCVHDKPVRFDGRRWRWIN